MFLINEEGIKIKDIRTFSRLRNHSMEKGFSFFKKIRFSAIHFQRNSKSNINAVLQRPRNQSLASEGWLLSFICSTINCAD